MRKLPLFLFVVISAVGLMGEPVPEGLIQRLQDLRERDRSILQVEVQLGKKDAEPETVVRVTEGPSGLSIEWPAPLVERFGQERKKEGAKGKENELLDRAKPSALYGFLHAADKVLRSLENAEFLGEKHLNEGGQMLREFTFKLDPGLDAEAKKYVKEITLELKLVTGEDYTPQQATATSHVKGRALMVLTFGEDATETFDFDVFEGRLVTTRHTRDSKASGSGGEREERTQAVIRRI